MKALLGLLLTVSFLTTFGQKGDTTLLKQQTKDYITKLYINKEYDSASLMWDKRMYLEMGDFYIKRNQGHLTDRVLYERVKYDVSKYLHQLDKFTLNKFLRSSIEEENGILFGHVFFEYTEVLLSKPRTVTTMLVFLSQNQGINWIIQDWKIKDIVDKVFKKLI